MAIAGDSAGGGLAVACQLQLRSFGLPMPACIVSISPWVDLEGIGESISAKADVDLMVGREVFDWFAEATVEVELKTWDEMVHVWHLFAPMLYEGAEAIA